jgi:hypothetical protein
MLQALREYAQTPDLVGEDVRGESFGTLPEIAATLKAVRKYEARKRAWNSARKGAATGRSSRRSSRKT